MNLGTQVYELAYVKSPIFLTNGIATLIPGGVLPLIAITESLSLSTSLLQGKINLSLDDFWANFYAMPGATLHNLQIGNYPFANQQVAANAVIGQPLNVSMRMNTTPRLQGGMVTKILTASALKFALDQHNFNGGTYSVLTPSYFYTGCVMTGMKDITSGDSHHQQTDWQLDFVQPLLSISQTVQVQNSLLSKLTGGLPL